MSGERPSPAWWALALVAYAAGVGGLVCVVVFLNGWVPAAIDGPVRHGVGAALAIDLALALAWGIQHSIMARAWFKEWLAATLPRFAHRSVYVLASGLTLIAVAVVWSPPPGELLVITDPVVAWILTVGGLAGWALQTAATFEIGHAELMGLAQVGRAGRGEREPRPEFRARFLYAWVRHPIQLGILIGLWVTPSLTVSRVVFAGLMSAYIVVGLRLEERALLREFGQEYRDYRGRVPMLFPWPRPGASSGGPGQ